MHVLPLAHHPNSYATDDRDEPRPNVRGRASEDYWEARSWQVKSLEPTRFGKHHNARVSCSQTAHRSRNMERDRIDTANSSECLNKKKELRVMTSSWPISMKRVWACFGMDETGALVLRKVRGVKRLR